ncbi:MAG TPA: tetratricopeptide repeat protein [Candidatus Angelobacter sp.]|nr:tetratricopeptide repeat protein [Candidatus Angelobacter sp.]
MPVRKTTPEVEVDLGRYELRRFGQRIKIEKKPMELLIFLLGRREQMVSREEIAKRLWRSDLFIDTEKNINNIVRKLRTALGDNGERQHLLETVVGKGYRLVGPVRMIGARVSGTDSLRTASDAGGRADWSDWGGRPSIVVRPLLLLGKATDDQGLCLGFADALATGLGNLPGVDVLPISAGLDLPADMSPTEIASRLGVRFVVHGAIQLSKGQWHLSMKMYDSSLERSCFKKECVLDLNRLSSLETEVARQISTALNRPFSPSVAEQRPRYSRDPMAYAEYMRGYRITVTGNASMMDKASEHLTNAVTRDPNFALAHATLSFACAKRHFEFDPASIWLEKAEFHCRRALEIDPNLAEAYMARSFLLWGPSRNFQHLEALADLKHALSLQKNLPHAYNRLVTILSHIGLLDRAREMYERGRPFQPQHAVISSIIHVYVWSQEYDRAQQLIESWRAEDPGNRYPIYFAAYVAVMTGNRREASKLLKQALQLVPNDPLIFSLKGQYHAMTGDKEAAMEWVGCACAIPKSFGHAHHTYYQIACTFALLEQRETAFEWLERSVSTGFACWPLFLKDPCLAGLRGLADFEVLISALQAKYPDHLGLL